MNWNDVKKFNFSWATDGGAWLEDGNQYRQWYPWNQIVEKLGQIWIDRQMKKQGWMTGCWIDCV